MVVGWVWRGSCPMVEAILVWILVYDVFGGGGGRGGVVVWRYLICNRNPVRVHTMSYMGGINSQSSISGSSSIISNPSEKWEEEDERCCCLPPTSTPSGLPVSPSCCSCSCCVFSSVSEMTAWPWRVREERGRPLLIMGIWNIVCGPRPVMYSCNSTTWPAAPAQQPRSFLLRYLVTVL